MILNPATQYFPSAEYLGRVLEGAAQRVTPCGRIFVGDVRSLPLLEAFHASVRSSRAETGISTRELREQVARHAHQDQELAVDPAFFFALQRTSPRISEIEILPKRGRFDNELSRFRFDAILHVEGGHTPSEPTSWRDWRADGMTLEVLQALLEDPTQEEIALSGVPNARTQRAALTAELLASGEGGETLAGLQAELTARMAEAPGVDTDDVRQLASTAGAVWTSLAAARADGSFDVVIRRGADVTSRPAFPRPARAHEEVADLTNSPLSWSVSRNLVPALREHARSHLPDYMVPASFVLLDRLPLTPNGKLDRAALPAPSTDRPVLSTEYMAPTTSLEYWLVELWQKALGVDRVGVSDNFFDLGGDSLRGAVLINHIHTELKEQLYIVALFDAPTVAEQSSYLQAHFSQALARRFGRDEPTRDESGTTPVAPSVDDRAIEHFRRLASAWRRTGTSVPGEEPRNPSMCFILTTPRSGSSLLRIMLAGHPDLFSPPELELLSFNTMGERRDAYQGRLGFLREGALRAVMEIRDCSAEEAKGILSEHEAADLSVPDFYRLLQTWTGGRTLVDKSATYSLLPDTLARAEAHFRDSVYIHLIRHPHGTIRSFQKARMDRILTFGGEHSYSARDLAELIWIVSHQNVLKFLDAIPAHRQLRVRFEDLVREPRQVMEAICGALGVPTHPSLLKPYEDQARKMTDGINPHSMGMTDTRFHEHTGIDPSVADSWRRESEEHELSEVTWRLAEEFGYERPPRADADRPPTSGVGSADADVIRAVPRGPEHAPPASAGQQRLWLVDRLEPGSPAYNSSRAIRLSGRLDVPALERSLREIVRRHKICRTNFDWRDGQLVQVIRDEPSPELKKVDLTGLIAEQRQNEIGRIATEELMAPFDLTSDPLWRAVLVHVSSAEHVLVLSIHHILSDAWSRGVIHRELSTLYRAFSAGEPSPLPELTIQYSDFAIWQQKWLESPPARRQLSYWREQLAGAPTLEVPTDRPRPTAPSHRGAQEVLPLPDELVRHLEALGRAEGVTFFMTLLAGYKILLARSGAQQDIVVGSPIAGRGNAKVESLIGMFVNLLVLRTDLSGDPWFRTLLARVRETCLDAYAHQELPFNSLVAELNVQRSLDRHPLFQVTFGLYRPVLEDLELPGLRCTSVPVETRPAPFDLSMAVFEEVDGVKLVVDYSTDLFDPATIQRMASEYRELLEAIAEDPGRRVSEL